MSTPVQGKLRDLASGQNSVLQRILAEQSTAHLLIVHEQGNETVQELIYIHQGMVLGCSTAIQMPVRHILLEHGLITPDDVAAAEKAAALQNRPDLLPEHFLVHYGKVTMQQVLVTVGATVKEIVIRALTAEQGLFMFKPAESAVPQRTLSRLPWVEVAVAYARRHPKPASVISTMVGPDSVLQLAQDVESLRERMRLLPQEWKILFRVDGRLTLEELRAETPLAPEEFDRHFLTCLLGRAILPIRAAAAASPVPMAPPAPAPQPPPPPPPPPAPSKPRRRVLIVDDSVTIQELVKEALQPLDLNMETADDGYAALSMAQEHTPDLVILDVMMPGIDGYKTCSSLRKLFGQRKVPIVMLTAKDGTFSLIKGKMAGATDYMTKPFDAEELRDNVAGLLEKHKAG